MFALLRRDPIIGSQSLKWGVIAALNAGVMAGLVTSLAATSQALVLGRFANLILLATITWLNVALFPIFGKARERCHALDMALPLPAQKLWLSHILALTLSGLGYLALTIGLLELLFWAFRKAPLAFSALQQALGDLIVPICVCLILVVVLLQSMGPTLYRIPRTGKYTLYSFTIVISALGLILGLSVLPPLTSLVPLVLAFYLGYRTYRSVPSAFTLVPFEADSVEAPAASDRVEAETQQFCIQDWEQHVEAGGTRGIAFGWFLFRLFNRRTALNVFATVFYYSLVILWGFFLSGFMFAWKGVELPQFSYVILAGYILLSFFPAQISLLHVIDPLPISRKLLAAFLMIPGVLGISIGLGVGRIGAILIQKSKLQIQYQEAPSGYFPPYQTRSPMVRVPDQYCKIAWNGQPPESGSPWGESHPAWKYPIYAGSRIAVYSPFSTPEGCSPQFVALQISRAIQAIYGKSVPYQEILVHHLEVKDNGSVDLKNGGLPLIEDYPDLKSRGGIPLFPILMLMSGVTWLLMASVYLRACRATVTDYGRKVVYFGLGVVVMGSILGQVAAMIAGFVRPDVGAAFLKILMRDISNALPGSNLMVWLICILLLMAAYWPAQTQFKRVEVLPGRPSR